jgi:hypothetical protein
MQTKAKHRKCNPESGVALLFALFTLLLLSAIAASLVFMTNTETSVNNNYRSERLSAFAAKAGMEEVRDRMAALNTAAKLPTTFPPAAGSVLYVLNEGAAPGTVQPWVAGNTYMDDEMCHDFAVVQGQQPAPNVRCTTAPSSALLVAGTLAAPVTSNYPWAGTTAALRYKWVRVTLKQSNSVQLYPVNGNVTTQVCWNGAAEVLLNGAATCQTMSPSTNPVYMITSLAASDSGATRRMVQTEVALTPAQPFPYGLFATGTACPALNFHGGGNSNPATDSFTTANNGTYATTQTNTLGDVGANGGVSLSGHSEIGGVIAVPSLLATPPAAPNPCSGAQGDYSTNGGNAGPYNPGNQFPGNAPTSAGVWPYVFPTPPDPIPAPPNTAYNGGSSLVPGTYGNVSTNGTLTLAPGVYNMYSLSVGGGQGNVTVAPPGVVVINFPSASANPLSIAGQGIVNPTLIANNFQINYGGTGTMSITGKGLEYAVIDAPNAAMAVAGNGEFFGRIVAKTIDFGGNGKFHFDRNSALGPQSNGGYQVISMREISY